MRRTPAFVALFVLCAAIAASLLLLRNSADPDRNAAQSQTTMTISKETTYLTEPLTEDGYVDYLAGLNAMSAQGVTRENNAAVLLYQAFGPEHVPRQQREHVARLLGIDPLPDEGNYFLDELTFLRRNRDQAMGVRPDCGPQTDPSALAQFDRARERPWSRSDSPQVAAWLEQNERALDLIVAASRRERYYFPLVSSGESAMLIEVTFPLAQAGRPASRALSARAMLRVQAGEVDAAWQDVLACHRLARLIGQGPMIVEGLVGIAIEGVASQANAAVAHHGNLTAEQARRFAAELNQLPPMPSMVEKINGAERLMFLDAVAMMARRGPAEISRLARGQARATGAMGWLTNSAATFAINWDEPMRMGNDWYDRFTEAFYQPTRGDRDGALHRIDDEIKQMASQATNVTSLLGEFVTSSPRCGSADRANACGPLAASHFSGGQGRGPRHPLCRFEPGCFGAGRVSR